MQCIQRYFATLGDKLVEKLPSSGTNTFKNYLSSSIKNSIFFHPTDKYEISSLIRKLKENKSQAQIILDLS